MISSAYVQHSYMSEDSSQLYMQVIAFIVYLLVQPQSMHPVHKLHRDTTDYN